nr:tigger transposable element-derived protein 6-like [Rhipicephalus microplus]
MTAELFQAWLRQLDCHFAAKAQKMLFVLGNCSAHMKVSGLENIELLFVPPNTTASQQPMDQGIIEFVKSRYQRQVIQQMLLCMESGKQYEVDLLSATQMLAYVRNNTPPVVVANCFRHSDLVHGTADPGVVADEETGKEQDGHYVCIMPADVPLGDYFAIDSDVAMAGTVTDSDIVAEVLGGEGESADEDARITITPAVMVSGCLCQPDNRPCCADGADNAFVRHRLRACALAGKAFFGCGIRTANRIDPDIMPRKELKLLLSPSFLQWTREQHHIKFS